MKRKQHFKLFKVIVDFICASTQSGPKFQFVNKDMTDLKANPHSPFPCPMKMFLLNTNTLSLGMEKEGEQGLVPVSVIIKNWNQHRMIADRSIIVGTGIRQDF